MTIAAAAEQLWFLNSLITVHVSETQGRDGISVLEHRLSHGDSAPLHLHRNEDEVYQVLDGELRLRVGDQERRVSAGQVMLLPMGVPHTYRVESPGGAGARLLTTTVNGDFERFVRAVSRPAERAELPPRGGPPTPEAIKGLTACAAQYGIDIIGPPLA